LRADAAAAPAPEPAAPSLAQPAVDFLSMRKQLAELSAALVRERNQRGVIRGDALELDRLEKTAETELGRAHWAATLTALTAALELVQRLEVDREFIADKIDRYARAVQERPSLRSSVRCQEVLSRARAALQAGDLAAANRELNRAFERLRPL
jgi:hypothetical protein